MSQSPTRIEAIKTAKIPLRQNTSSPAIPNIEFMFQGEKSTNNNKKFIRLGVCAMEKKTSCEPMKEILNRLATTGDLAITIFPEAMILNVQPIEWPIVDCLITFHSSGFPLDKVRSYIELRKPYLINELKFQESMLWRHKVYDILVKHGIPVPKHYIFIDEKTAKRHKKPHLSTSNLFSLDNSSQLSGFSNSKGGKQFDFDCIECSGDKLFKQDSALGLDNSPKLSLSRRISEEDSVTVNPSDEERKDDLEIGNCPGLSREVSITSVNKSNSQELKIDTCSCHKRKFSDKEHRQCTKNGDHTDSDSFQGESFKSPLSNYYKKYHTKIEEFDDYILIGEQKLKKPFVEKPLSAEDHQINIYYPKCDGGGCKCLFRKTGNVSSSFEPNSNQIRSGSFVYEEFLPTDGFDIKVYTIGPNYAHAETRKSPVLDGVVQRTKEGKEVRFPVNLTHEEKIIAKKIVFAFDQQICGFDLLRSKGKSYVCDVNGWSFVKGNQKYYTDCAILLRGMILAKFAPELLTPLNPILSQINKIKHDAQENIFRPCLGEKISYDKEELRSVVAIFRHGDRTPKQKMKMITTDQRYLDLFNDQQDKRKEVKVKTVQQLQRILDMTQEIIEEFYSANRPKTELTVESISKHFQLFSVLKKNGHFEGINRKIQLKPLEWKQVVDPETNETKEIVKKGLFILKWGGELTHSGIEQAEELGALFRNQVYPQDNEGLLRLHSTYRHDLKIYSSQEGRCQKTAASFCKGLLELEGDLRPIMVSMVRKDEVAQEMLEFEKTQESTTTHEIKDTLSKLLNSDESLYEAVKNLIGEENMDQTMRELLKDIGAPLTMLKRTHELVRKLAQKIKQALATNEDSYYLSLNDLGYGGLKLQDIKLGKKPDSKTEDQKCEEVTILVFKRWKKLENDFYSAKTGTFDISKIPDIYYSIRYDVLHSKKLVEANQEICQELLDCSQKLAKFVIPAEYGLSDEERIGGSLHIVKNLIKKVTHDLIWWDSPYINQAEQVDKDEQSFFEHKGLNTSTGDAKNFWRHIRTRLYFTSASHLHSLYNVISMGLRLFYPGTDRFRSLPRHTSLAYLSHIMIRLYENLNANPGDPNRFRLEIMLSQGSKMDGYKIGEQTDHRVPVAPSIVLSSQLTLKELEEFLNGLSRLGNAKSETNL